MPVGVEDGEKNACLLCVIENYTNVNLRDVCSELKIPTDSQSLADDVFVGSRLCESESVSNFCIEGDSFTSKSSVSLSSRYSESHSRILNTAFISNKSSFELSCSELFVEKKIFSATDVKNGILSNDTVEKITLPMKDKPFCANLRNKVIPNTEACHKVLIYPMNHAVTGSSVSSNLNVSPTGLKMSPQLPDLRISISSRKKMVFGNEDLAAKQVNYFPPLLSISSITLEKSENSSSENPVTSKGVISKAGVISRHNEAQLADTTGVNGFECHEKTLFKSKNVCLQQEFACNGISGGKPKVSTGHEPLTTSRAVTNPVCTEKTEVSLCNLKAIQGMVENELQSLHPLLEQQSFQDGIYFPCHKMVKDLSTIHEVDSHLSKSSQLLSNWEKSPIKKEQPVCETLNLASNKIGEEPNFENKLRFLNKKHSKFKSKIPIPISLLKHPNSLGTIIRNIGEPLSMQPILCNTKNVTMKPCFEPPNPVLGKLLEKGVDACVMQKKLPTDLYCSRSSKMNCQAKKSEISTRNSSKLSLENRVVHAKPRNKVVPKTENCDDVVMHTMNHPVIASSVPVNLKTSVSLKLSPKLSDLYMDISSKNINKNHRAKKFNQFPPLFNSMLTYQEPSFVPREISKDIPSEETIGKNYKTHLADDCNVEPVLKCNKHPQMNNSTEKLCLQQEFVCSGISGGTPKGTTEHQSLTSKGDIKPVCTQRTETNLLKLGVLQAKIADTLRSYHPLLEQQSFQDGIYFPCHGMVKELSTIQEVDSHFSKSSKFFPNWGMSPIKIRQSVCGILNLPSNKTDKKSNFDKLRSVSRKHSRFKSKIPVPIFLTKHPNLLREVIRNNTVTHSIQPKVPVKPCSNPRNPGKLFEKDVGSYVMQNRLPSKLPYSLHNDNGYPEIADISSSRCLKLEAFEGVAKRNSSIFATFGSPFNSTLEEKGILEEPELTLIGSELTIHSFEKQETCHVSTDKFSESLMSFVKHEAECLCDSIAKSFLLK